EEPGVGGRVGDRGAMAPDGVPGAEPAGAALAGAQGPGPGQRADARPRRVAASGLRPSPGDDASPAAEGGRRVVRSFLVTYLDPPGRGPHFRLSRPGTSRARPTGGPPGLRVSWPALLLSRRAAVLP